MKLALFTFSSVLLTSSAVAATPGYYIYGGAGYSGADFNLDSVSNYFEPNPNDDATVSNIRNNDKTALALKVAAGYRFNDYFAIEGSYAYLGKSTAKIEGTHETVAIGDTSLGTHKDFAGMNASMTAHVLSLDALAIYPLNKHLEIFAKAGAGLALAKTQGTEWDGYYSASGDLGSYDCLSFSKSKVRFVPKLGVGFEWNATNKIAVRIEYERMFGISKDSDYSVDADYDCVNVGIKYSF